MLSQSLLQAPLFPVTSDCSLGPMLGSLGVYSAVAWVTNTRLSQHWFLVLEGLKGVEKTGKAGEESWRGKARQAQHRMAEWTKLRPPWAQSLYSNGEAVWKEEAQDFQTVMHKYGYSSIPHLLGFCNFFQSYY